MSICPSPKYGVNPCLLLCPICGKDAGVGLLGKLPDDAEAPHKMQGNFPCLSCEEMMKISIRVIETDEAGVPTGNEFYLKDEAAKRMFTHFVKWEDILKHRALKLEAEALKMLGFYDTQH